MQSEPLVIRREGAVFSLRRIGDDEMHRLGRRATAIEDDSLFWLQWHCRRHPPKRLTLPEFLVAMIRRFGPSGFALKLIPWLLVLRGNRRNSATAEGRQDT
jgi:hypothetical protein